MEQQSKRTEVPEFCGDRAAILRDLLALAMQKPDNTVWYAIERVQGRAGDIVNGIINQHEMRQDSEGEPFASFIVRILEGMIGEQEPKSTKVDTPKERPTSREIVRPKPDDLNAKIKAALGRHSTRRGQWSNQHSKPRR